MSALRIALDWTPNTLHAPLLVALSQGFYREAGLSVTIVSPTEDAYETTPAKKLLAGDADLAICPSESVIAYAEETTRSGAASSGRIEAVFALLDRDASAILCSAGSDIKRPRDLDGKVYGSYNARYEDEIVKAMIRNDGGKGQIVVAQDVPKLDLFNILTMPAAGKVERSSVEGQHIDATWIFSPWEGIKCKESGFAGVEFKMDDYAVPYGYSPVIARVVGSSVVSDAVLAKFVEATRKAYAFIEQNHAQATEILSSWCEEESRAFLSQSLADIAQYWRHDGKFGLMEEARWSAFLQFLKKEGLLGKEINARDLFVSL